MAEYLSDLTPRSEYVDRKQWLRDQCTLEEFKAKQQMRLNSSKTVYVSNLTFYTTEAQIEAHFAHCGAIEAIVMGLAEASRTPCGFCFVVFETVEAAWTAYYDCNRTLLDDRVIGVGRDPGFSDDRRWGRGWDGQVVDRLRGNVDYGRGGLGSSRADANSIAKCVFKSDLRVYDWVPPKQATQSDKGNESAKSSHQQRQKRQRE